MHKLGSSVSLKNTKVKGIIVGKGFVETDGKVEEKLIVKIDTSDTTLQDIASFLGDIVIDPREIVR